MQALSETTINLVQATVPALEIHGLTIVRMMYERMFRYPSIEALFNQSHQGNDGSQPAVSSVWRVTAAVAASPPAAADLSAAMRFASAFAAAASTACAFVAAVRVAAALAASASAAFAKRIVALNLRRLRIAAGVSQDDLALSAGVDRGYVGRAERASVNPTLSTLEKLANALGVPVADLCCRRPMPKQWSPSRTGGRRDEP